MSRPSPHAPTSPAGMLSVLMAVASIALAPAARADVTNPAENKPGFVGRVFGFGKKTEPAPAPPPTPPAQPKAKSSTPPASKAATPSKPAAKSATKSTPAKPSEAKPVPAVIPKPDPARPEPPPTKPEENTAGTPGEKRTDPAVPLLTGEFAQDRGEPRPKLPPPPATPLPATAAGQWKIVKVAARDYVTGDSLHRFYRFSSYKVEGRHVWLRSNNLILKATIGSQEMLINNIKFILSYPVMEADGQALFSRLDLSKLIDPVLRPTHITDAVPFDTVVVDAGHGGHDAGARGIYGYEKDFALKMAFVLREQLIQRGFKVVMTRSSDEFITLGGRVAIANNTPNSIFVSLHFNSGGSAATGIETFALTPQGSAASLERGGGFNFNGLTGNAHDSANIALATAVHAMVISKFKFVDRGIKRAQWSVLTGCRRPGILFEGGFVTNPTECGLIASDTYRRSVSSAIADAVVNYRTALKGAYIRRR